MKKSEPKSKRSLIDKIFIYGIFFLFLLGQLGRLSFLGQEVNVYLYEPVLAVYTLYLLYKYKLKPFKNKLAYLIAGFLGILTLSLLLSLSQFKVVDNVIAFLYLTRLSFYFLFFLVFLFACRVQKELKRTVFGALVMVGVGIIVLSLLQYFLYPDLRNLFYLGWDPHLYRIFGLFFDTFLSSAMFGVMALFFFFAGDGLLKNKIVKGVFIVFYLALILFTYSRSLYIGFGITIFVVFARRHLLPVILFLVVFVGVLFILPRPFGEGVNLLRTYSITSRSVDYETAVSWWIKKPILGYGYNHIRPVKEERGLIDPTTADITHAGASFHSSFLIILATSGILGLIAYLVVMMVMARLSFAGGILIGFLAILSFSDNVLLHPFILFILFSLIAYFSNPFGRSPSDS